MCVLCCLFVFFFLFQAEDGIRDLVRSRGLGDVYKRQVLFDHIHDLVGGDEFGHRVRERERTQAHRVDLDLSLIHI